MRVELVIPMQQELATVLDLLYVTNETLTADEIAAATHLPLEDVEQALSLLEHHGHVSIGVKADNSRFFDIAITGSGIQAVEDYQPHTDTSNIQYDPVPGYWGFHGTA